MVGSDKQQRAEIVRSEGGTDIPPNPRWLERAGNIESLADVAHRIVLRACQAASLISAVVILGLLIFLPDKITIIIDLIKLIISSGQGFAIPAVLLVVFAPKFLELMAASRRRPPP